MKIRIIIMAMSHKNTCPWIGGPLRVRRYIALPCPLTKLSDDGVEAGLRGHVYEAAAEAVVREHQEHLLAVWYSTVQNSRLQYSTCLQMFPIFFSSSSSKFSSTNVVTVVMIPGYQHLQFG